MGVPMLADHDQILGWIHCEVRDRERQLMRLCRDRWIGEIRIEHRRQGYKTNRGWLEQITFAMVSKTTVRTDLLSYRLQIFITQEEDAFL